MTNRIEGYIDFSIFAPVVDIQLVSGKNEETGLLASLIPVTMERSYCPGIRFRKWAWNS
jgi:hypothetical protein